MGRIVLKCVDVRMEVNVVMIPENATARLDSWERCKYISLCKNFHSLRISWFAGICEMRFDHKVGNGISTLMASKSV